MQIFLIVTKIITGVFAVIWNVAMRLINGIISLINNYVRKRNDRIKRGVTELKNGTLNDILPFNSSVNNIIVSGAYEKICEQHF